MLINTRDFGQTQVGEENLFNFPAGLFAFEDSRTFALISPLGEDVYPKWLQAVDALTPCFIVFDPSFVDSEYGKNIKLEFHELQTLKIQPGSTDNTDKKFLVIATVPDDFKKTTVNMKAPIVINAENRLAIQTILPRSKDFDYDFRFPLYDDNADISDKTGVE
jgi:flagellar assembly factor FliW